jgi:hypothetical protein
MMANQSTALTTWVRLLLLALALCLIALFVAAGRIDPYDGEGNSLRLGTHRQLGLPPCSFMQLFGRPCPHCGMTTSFALLAHGDLVGSMRANFVGTLLAIASVAAIVWALLSTIRRRWVWVQPTETWLLLGIVGIIGLALVRWVIVVGAPWLAGYG